jgi:hypothetical protein
VGPKPAGSDHVHFPAKQGFQVNLELGMVEQGPAELASISIEQPVGVRWP